MLEHHVMPQDLYHCQCRHLQQNQKECQTPNVVVKGDKQSVVQDSFLWDGGGQKPLTDKHVGQVVN